ncbi:hypothetical protein QQ045_004592 [Rhodiola kirilowii]
MVTKRKTNRKHTEKVKLLEHHPTLEDAGSANRSINQPMHQQPQKTFVKDMEKLKVKGLKMLKRKAVRFGYNGHDLNKNSTEKNIASLFEVVDSLMIQDDKRKKQADKQGTTTPENKKYSPQQGWHHLPDAGDFKNDVNSISQVSETIKTSEGETNNRVNVGSIFYSEELRVLVHPKAIPHFNKITKGAFKKPLELEQKQI